MILKGSKKFYDSKEMEQVFQRGCRISILTGAQNVSGCSPEQPAIADPALSNGKGLDDFQSCLSTSLNNKLDLKSTLQSLSWFSR